MLTIFVACCFAAVVIAAPLRLQPLPSISVNVRSGSHSFQPLSYRSSAKEGGRQGNFVPLPPPIQCDDFYANNGVSCFYLVNAAKKLVTPLAIGNISMPENNPHFVVDPPTQISDGGWFSFHSLLNWSNQTAPLVPWSGFVHYSAKDADGNTYDFRADFKFEGGTVDIGLAYPEKVGIDIKPEVNASTRGAQILIAIQRPTLQHPHNRTNVFLSL
jgi:hypothetical protein